MNIKTAHGRTLFSAVSIACLGARTAAANVDFAVVTPSPVDRPGAAPREAAEPAAASVGSW